MISTICFSKDRPLQLHAYLESLMYFSGMKAGNIAVLYKDSEAIPYDAVISNFPSVVWLKEVNFLDDLQGLIHVAGDIILWGCDDVVFKNFFDLDQLERCFADPLLLCVSLRYGGNVKGYAVKLLRLLSQEGDLLTFERNMYPWDVSAAMYRRVDIMTALHKTLDTLQKNFETSPDFLLAPTPQFITGPNTLEYHVYHTPTFEGLSHMACYKTSRSVSFSVNRVQEVMINTFDCKDPSTNENALYALYLAGKRLDWQALEGWDNMSTHEPSERFKLK